MLRSLIYVIWLYLWGIVLGVLTLPFLLLPRALLVGTIRLYARIVLFGLRWICGVKVEFRGLEHVPEGAALVAAKHQAMVDIFIPFLIFKDPVMVMKRELLWYPVLGWTALKTRMLPIDRSGGAKTMRAMLKAAATRVPEGNGRQMFIFPEGTRTAPGAPPSYKPAGVRAFYKALDVPLVPVATNAGLCWPAHGIRRTPGTVIYEVLPAIEPGLEHKDMLARLQGDLEAASARLLDEGLAVQGRTRADLA